MNKWIRNKSRTAMVAQSLNDHCQIATQALSDGYKSNQLPVSQVGKWSEQYLKINQWVEGTNQIKGQES